MFMLEKPISHNKYDTNNKNIRFRPSNVFRAGRVWGRKPIFA